MADQQRPEGGGAGQMAELDETDRRIVAELRGDGRRSMRALAAALHISRANVYSRVARLERDGVITGYTALVDPQRYGHTLSAYVYLKVQQQAWKRLQERLLDIPEVDHAAYISGEHDIVLLVRTRDAAALRDLVLTRLQDMPEVVSTQTVLIFDEMTQASKAGRTAPA
jgi:DNA-binding Lrp family transcriptional regulator